MTQSRRKKSTLPRLSEKEFTAQVLQLAKLCGWKSAHFRPAQTVRGWRTPVQGEGVGFPDLILIRGAACLAVELKADDGKLASEQAAWLLAFSRAGVPAVVWRPRNWDHILKVLNA